MTRKKIIQKTVAKMFKRYDKDFVNELARLLILYGDKVKITTTSHRFAMFLGQVMQEINVKKSGKVRMREYMNYSEDRLKVPFRIFRRNPKLAKKYGQNKYHKANRQMIANIAYANRLGNGAVSSGDGWKYRGAGILQTTGRNNFEKDIKTVEKITGINLHDNSGAFHTKWADNYTIGILLGMANWYRTKMYKAKTMDDCTRIINRHTTSYGERRRNYAKAKKILQNLGK